MEGRVLQRSVGQVRRLRRSAKLRFNLFEPVRILPFRGYGTSTRVFLNGRVLEEDGIVAIQRGDDLRAGVKRSTWQNLKDSWRRFRSEEIPNARLEATLGNQHVEFVTDDKGYFHRMLELEEPLDPGWHEVEFDLLESVAGAGARAVGQVLVPPEDAEFGVISDIDDTVIQTGVTHPLKMLRVVLFNDAQTRIPFPGVAAFYRALKLGRNGTGSNPVFYVSRSPWNLYDLYEAFFEVQRIPRGPLFLRDFSLEQDKLTRIRQLLALYPRMSFVLIGDSGEHDPELYAQVVEEHPTRIRAVYIRDVTSRRREREVQALSDRVREHDIPMLLAKDTPEAASHAFELGLISARALPEIREKKQADVEHGGPEQALS